MEEQTKKSYEVSFLARGEEAAASVISHLSKVGAEILKEDKIEQMDLSYPVKKHNSAHFGCVHFSAEPDSIETLENALKFEDGILRYLIITPPIVSEDSKVQRDTKETRPTERIQIKPVEQTSGVVSNEALEAKLEEISETDS